MTGSRLGIWLFCLVALLVLILFGHVNPLAYLLLGTWLPLPLLLVGWRLGTGAAVLLALAGVLAVFALNPGLAVLLDNLGLGMILLLGLVLTAGSRRGWPAGTVIMISVAGVGLVYLVLFFGQAYFQGLTPLALWEQKTREVANTFIKMLKETGVDSPSFEVMGLSRVNVQDMVTRLVPALVLVNAGLVAWLNILACRRLVSSWGWDDVGEPLSQWSSPEWLVFFFVGAGFALLAPWAWVRQVGLNLLIILGFVYFCQGMAVIAGLLQGFQVPWVLRGLAYLLAFMNPLMILVMILGLMDLWLDFRRLRPPREA